MWSAKLQQTRRISSTCLCLMCSWSREDWESNGAPGRLMRSIRICLGKGHGAWMYVLGCVGGLLVACSFIKSIFLMLWSAQNAWKRAAPKWEVQILHRCAGGFLGEVRHGNVRQGRELGELRPAGRSPAFRFFSCPHFSNRSAWTWLETGFLRSSTRLVPRRRRRWQAWRSLGTSTRFAERAYETSDHVKAQTACCQLLPSEDQLRWDIWTNRTRNMSKHPNTFKSLAGSFKERPLRLRNCLRTFSSLGSSPAVLKIQNAEELLVRWWLVRSLYWGMLSERRGF